MLDDDLKTQLQAYLERVTQPFEMVASLDDSDSAREMQNLLQTVASLSDKITLRTDGTDARKPSFSLRRSGTEMNLRFAAIPLGHEFTSLVLALLWTGGHPPKVEADLIEQIKALDGDFNFEVYMSLTCHNCPDVVQALSLMAVLNPRIKTVVIDGGLFPAEVDERQIMAVPSVYLNGAHFGSGRMDVAEILAKLDTGTAARDAAKLSAKAPYEVLIVGGGPAGAAAAVYAARKGIRTGIAAERFGGQVNDTLAIENYISVPETDGPKFVAGLEAHVKAYDVDVMNLQRADKLVPAATPGGLIELQLANGATLKSRSIILTTGARWRNVNVPGEQEYKNHGVAYCPHCDGPLFKGKHVAVIGGGNSGVEAAIDLAGVVAKVTLLEQQLAEGTKAEAAATARANVSQAAIMAIAKGGGTAAEKAAAAAPYVAVSQAAASELATLQVADQATALRLEVAKTVEMPQILHVAKVPDSPSGPSRTLNVAAGALAGLVVGVIVAFVRRRVRGA